MAKICESFEGTGQGQGTQVPEGLLRTFEQHFACMRHIFIISAIMDPLEPGQNFTNAQVGNEIQEKFFTFLEEYTPRDEGISMSQASAGSNGEPEIRHTYVEQLKTMRESEKTTLYVDFEHLQDADSEFADILKDQYLRVDAYLRKVQPCDRPLDYY